jgi:ElaB/YqjD/DUF883 family membrane-anchored ribosome-binding protein
VSRSTCIADHSWYSVLQITNNENPRLERSRKFQQLIDDVEELLARLDDEHSPQIDDLRRRLEATVSALNEQGRSTAAQLKHYAEIADGYITGYPRTSFASGILIGGLLGFLLASVRSRD